MSHGFSRFSKIFELVHTDINDRSNVRHIKTKEPECVDDFLFIDKFQTYFKILQRLLFQLYFHTDCVIFEYTDGAVMQLVTNNDANTGYCMCAWKCETYNQSFCSFPLLKMCFTSLQTNSVAQRKMINIFVIKLLYAFKLFDFFHAFHWFIVYLGKIIAIFLSTTSLLSVCFNK